MKKLTSLFLLVAALFSGCVEPGQEQAPTGEVRAAVPGPAPKVASSGGISPHETISAKIDNNRVIIVYGRPFSKDPKTGEIRKPIWGGLVPYDKVWRCGSDEATLLITQQPIVMGDTTLPAGAYTLFMWPSEKGSKLIINKQIGQWGIDPYDEKQELARIDLKKDTLDKSVDEFTMTVEKNPTGGGLVTLSWENTKFSVAYTLKK